jgi:hypothetical protein
MVAGKTGDGKLILNHAGKLGFEGVVPKTIDAPYAPGDRDLWPRPKRLSAGPIRQERGRILKRSCSAISPMKASSPMEAA